MFFGVDTLIGDIIPPETLMKTLTDRKLAEEQKVTYDTQMKAQETRRTLEKETAIADMQNELVKADQGVVIAEKNADASQKKATGDANGIRIQAAAEGDRLRIVATGESEKIRLLADAEAERITKTGNAEAEKILAIGKSNAESYKLSVEAMGGDNFTQLKITESIGLNNVKVIPEVLITGNCDSPNGPISGLIGLELMKGLGKHIREGNKGDKASDREIIQ